MSRILDEHRQLLADDVRLRAFEAALAETVTPQHVVLDLASGTGILGFLAARAGARRVYAVDGGGIIQIARALAHANNLDDRIVFINGASTHVTLPEQVDLIVSDQIGQFGFDAAIVRCFEDARRRMLKPDGVFIPSRLTLMVAPVTAPEIRARIDFWKSPVMGFDLNAAVPIALNTGYPQKLRAEQVLGAAGAIATLDFAAGVPDAFKGEATLTIERAGTMHGLGGWFLAQLSEHVTMTNSPLDPGAIHRRNAILPISEPVDVNPGDHVRVAMHVLHAQLLVKWQVEVTTARGERRATSSHSTWSGTLLSTENLERMRPERVVSLTPWGLARRTILELCDGRRTAAAIEAAVLARHPDLFASPADAAQFVAEVVIRYSR